MTYLELVAAVGSVPMDIACMYFNGRLPGTKRNSCESGRKMI